MSDCWSSCSSPARSRSFSPRQPSPSRPRRAFPCSRIPASSCSKTSSWPPQPSSRWRRTYGSTRAGAWASRLLAQASPLRYLLPGDARGVRADARRDVATNVAKSRREVPLELRIPRAARRHNQRYEQELAPAHWVVLERQERPRDRGGPDGTTASPPPVSPATSGADTV